MNNPFKVGDKVVRTQYRHDGICVGEVREVVRVDGPRKVALAGGTKGWLHDVDNLRAAIAGQDYPAPSKVGNGPLEYAPNSGHLSDGSSVQKHSAGALYPCVLVWRDAKLGGMVYDDFGALVPAKYDVGVISPRNPEPLWFSNFDRAVSVAATIKEDLK